MAKQNEQLLSKLKLRFETNKHRHPNILWISIEEKLLTNQKALLTLQKMEDTGGEPDVVEFDKNVITFCDCAAESPQGRRSLCYDKKALDERKEFKPKNNAMDAAAEMGIKLLDEEQYKKLQTVGEFDKKTSSWLKTPDEIRKLGGAIFGDFRFGRVFIYHNGASSYYAARGFRAYLEL